MKAQGGFLEEADPWRRTAASGCSRSRPATAGWRSGSAAQRPRASPRCRC
jgi:hypothetical protein